MGVRGGHAASQTSAARGGPSAGAPGRLAGGGRIPIGLRGLSTARDGTGRRVPGFLLPLLLLLAALLLVFFETRDSGLQSIVFHKLASRLTWTVEDGPSPAVAFPVTGPFDERRGYSLLPQITDSLLANGYHIARQVRMSPQMLNLIDHGIAPIYPAKVQAGLTIKDQTGEEIYRTGVPERLYPDYASIPPLVRESLLYLENRELMQGEHPYRNPAVEWDRLARAVVDLGLNKLGLKKGQAGGSTLATQIEKYRHSAEGRTATPLDKVRQMTAASLRAYRDGRQTMGARERIVLDYVNSVPLAALPGLGEINGLGDGLWAWFGAGFAEVNRVLSTTPRTPREQARQGLAYKQVLALFLAQRRPSYYLLSETSALERETDQRCRLLARAGVISPELRDAALAARLEFHERPPRRDRPSFIERKATNAIRSRLLAQLPLRSLYQLDRLDLTVETTLDRPTQERVTRTLGRLADPAFADSAGLRGDRLLMRGDPANVYYSFTLYESTPEGNLLRAQADNLDQPLDINTGAKLDLGSTAKLRTLVHYLEVVSDLHAGHAGMRRTELVERANEAKDPIRRWAFGWMAASADTSLRAMCEAALQRKYSASPGERFFTGGGLHTFANFQKEDNGRVMPVAQAFRQSVNLVFIRMMRDLVRYESALLPIMESGDLQEPGSPARQQYLERFADEEGRVFLSRFWKRYAKQAPEKRLSLLAASTRPTPRRLAVMYRTARPEASPEELHGFLVRNLNGVEVSAADAASLHERYGPEAFSLADRGYLANVHPLELWLVAYLEAHPGATWKETVEASAEERQEVYQWLFRDSKKRAQDSRIRTLVEEDAFGLIHQAWRRLGYPFGSLVPSYATAIGSSADRPAALAELMGILINDGVRYPLQKLERLQFAEGTPFETTFDAPVLQGEQLLRPEVARAARACLIDVVENGTARRAAGIFTTADGEVIPFGGKTGTGDNRYETYAPGGRLIDSRVVNRTATFVFLIGDRFYGTVTAYVPGPGAERYVFTSALAVQVLKTLAPDLMPLVARPPA